MNILSNIIIGIATLVSGFLGGAQHFGNIALTTLNGSDRQNVFPTTYNANNLALNNGKLDVGTTSVASITTLASLTTTGTLISGALSTGFTAVNVPQGGTGSTTLSANQVLLGNGTSLMKTVTGWGTSGQFLTSTGAGTAPTWQSGSFDQTGTYVNTGVWTFATSTTYNANFGRLTATTSANLAAALTIGGVAYTYPSSQGIAGSVLINNGSGVLTFGSPNPPQYTYASTSQSTIFRNTSITSATTTIAAGVLTASSTITISGVMTATPTGNNAQAQLDIRDNAGNTYISQQTNISISNTCNLAYTVKIMATSLTSQKTTLFGNMICGSTYTNVFSSNTSSANFANALGMAIRVGETGNGLGSTATSEGFNLVINP